MNMDKQICLFLLLVFSPYDPKTQNPAVDEIPQIQPKKKQLVN